MVSKGGDTPLQVLEGWEGTDDAEPETLTHLKTLLAVPEELPALLAAQRRLALAKAMSPHLGAASSAAAGDVDVMQAIATESGVLGERASYHDVQCWGEEQEEEDNAYLQRVLSNVKSPKARALQVAVIAQLPAAE